MTRITPRTCLWPLAGSLSLCFALSIGLTFRSNRHCYAGTCGEWLFPLQARLHVVVWYCWLGISVTLLAVRAFQSRVQKILRTQLFERTIPVLGKHLEAGGVLISVWILALYGIIVGIWWVRLRDYFDARGIEGGVFSGNKRLAAIALTGHLCDVTMGMALIPISRHSALASFFKISVGTTLTFHMLTAYTLFSLVLIHGLLYVSWVPVFEGLPDILRRVYPVLNPTYLYREVWPGDSSGLGIWRASLIFTGSVSAFIMLLISITTLPAIRSRHFNLFYFTHLLGIVAVVVICLHASTMLYCTAPGLSMWLLDWMMRLYELWAPLNGTITSLGKGWYSYVCLSRSGLLAQRGWAVVINANSHRLSAPLPRRRLDGCACTSPLAHFYIHHSDSSVRELHPFTTITHLASQNRATHSNEEDITIQFLFRKRGAAKAVITPPSKHGFIPAVMEVFRRTKGRKPNEEWTNKLAGLADAIPVKPNELQRRLNEETPRQLERVVKGVPVSLRLEGPYFTPADPSRYRTVVCLIAGTGVSGALAIAGAFRELEKTTSSSIDPVTGKRIPSSRCSRAAQPVVPHGSRPASTFSSREGSIWTRCIVIWSVREDNFIELPELNVPSSGLDVRIHLTGNRRPRLSVDKVLDEILIEDSNNGNGEGKTWVYISGPNAFISNGEASCKKMQGRGVEWYGAKWDI